MLNSQFHHEEQQQSRQQRFDYGQFSEFDQAYIRTGEREISNLMRRESVNVYEIGKHLAQVRDFMRARGVKGRGFKSWVEQNDTFTMSRKHAYRHISVYETFHREGVNVDTSLFDDSALWLLCSNSCSQGLRQEFVSRAVHGEHITHLEVKQALDALKIRKKRMTPADFVGKLQEALTFWMEERFRVEGNDTLTDGSLYPERKAFYAKKREQIIGRIAGLNFALKLFACVQKGETPLIIDGDLPNEFHIEIAEIPQKWGKFDEYAIEIEGRNGYEHL